MSETPSDLPPTAPNDDDALRKRLLNRIAMAGVIVVALLGGLAVFDAMYVPPARKPAATIAKAPAEAVPAAPSVPAAPATEEPKSAEAPAVKPETEAKAEAPAAAKEPAKPEPPPPPEITATPSMPAAARPSAAAKPLTPPATARPAMIKPSEPVARPEAGKEPARTQPPPSASAGPLSKPLSKAVQAARQYVLQMGVFSNVTNAEELRAKLELNGIPAQIEARVQVGPFNTREEAAAAREKLRALGMDEGILTAIRK